MILSRVLDWLASRECIAKRVRENTNFEIVVAGRVVCAGTIEYFRILSLYNGNLFRKEIVIELVR